MPSLTEEQREVVIRAWSRADVIRAFVSRQWPECRGVWEWVFGDAVVRLCERLADGTVSPAIEEGALITWMASCIVFERRKVLDERKRVRNFTVGDKGEREESQVAWDRDSSGEIARLGSTLMYVAYCEMKEKEREESRRVLDAMESLVRRGEYDPDGVKENLRAKLCGELKWKGNPLSVMTRLDAIRKRMWSGFVERGLVTGSRPSLRGKRGGCGRGGGGSLRKRV